MKTCTLNERILARGALASIEKMTPYRSDEERLSERLAVRGVCRRLVRSALFVTIVAIVVYVAVVYLVFMP